VETRGALDRYHLPNEVKGSIEYWEFARWQSTWDERETSFSACHDRWDLECRRSERVLMGNTKEVEPRAGKSPNRQCEGSVKSWKPA
jgi:hypothetical protein